MDLVGCIYQSFSIPILPKNHVRNFYTYIRLTGFKYIKMDDFAIFPLRKIIIIAKNSTKSYFLILTINFAGNIWLNLKRNRIKTESITFILLRNYKTEQKSDKYCQNCQDMRMNYQIVKVIHVRLCNFLFCTIVIKNRD